MLKGTLRVSREGCEPIAALLACSVMLMFPAIYNGFPLAEVDSGVYLMYGVHRVVAWDRPVFYGLFALPFHMKYSLWPLVFVQGLVASHVLYLVIRVNLSKAASITLVACVFVLVAVSSLPWLTGQIMPDVFAALVILVMYLLGFQSNRLGKAEIVYLVALGAIFISTHLSYVPLALGMFVVIVAARLVSGERHRLTAGSLILLLSPMALASAALMTSNLIRHGEAVLSTGSSTFLLARVIADGPGRLYLDEACAYRSYALCRYRDLLDEDSDAFLWGKTEVRRRARDDVGSIAFRAEAKEIVRKSIEAHPWLQLKRSVENAAKQFISFSTLEVFPSGGRTSPVDAQIRDIFGDGASRAFVSSRLQNGLLPAQSISALHDVAIVGAAVSIVPVSIALIRRKKWALIDLYVVMVFGLLGNAIIAGALSCPHARYQARMIWLVVFCLFLGIAVLRQDGTHGGSLFRRLPPSQMHEARDS